MACYNTHGYLLRNVGIRNKKKKETLTGTSRGLLVTTFTDRRHGRLNHTHESLFICRHDISR